MNTAVTRVLTARVETGLFDRLEGQVYTKLGAEVVNASSHHAMVLEAALQGMVLLQNHRSVLPFERGRRVAVLGPHVNSTRDLFEVRASVFFLCCNCAS